MASLEQVTKAMAVLGLHFPADVSSEKIKSYHMFLQDMDAQVLNAAIAQCVTTCKFFPTIAEIRDAAFTIAGPQIPDALTAWQEVYKAIQRYGYDQRPEFDNPVTNKTIKGLGWSSLCISEDDQWLVKRFCDAYNAYAKSHTEEMKMLPAVKQTREQLKAQSEILQLAKGMEK